MYTKGYIHFLRTVFAFKSRLDHTKKVYIKRLNAFLNEIRSDSKGNQEKPTNSAKGHIEIGLTKSYLISECISFWAKSWHKSLQTRHFSSTLCKAKIIKFFVIKHAKDRTRSVDVPYVRDNEFSNISNKQLLFVVSLLLSNCVTLSSKIGRSFSIPSHYYSVNVSKVVRIVRACLLYCKHHCIQLDVFHIKKLLNVQNVMFYLLTILVRWVRHYYAK